MSRIFEALQKSSRGGFSDFASALQDPVSPENLQQFAAATAPVPAASPDLDQFPTLSISIPRESRILSLTERDSLGAEKFRFLGVRLRQLQNSRGLKKVLVTSTIPEEGKSTISANLAATLARKPQHRVYCLTAIYGGHRLGACLGCITCKA